MFRFLINQKISVKIAAMIIITASISIILAWYSSTAMQDIDRRYGELTDVRTPALIKLARTGRQSMQAAYDTYKVFAYPGASPEARAAAEDRGAMIERARQWLSEAKAAVPSISAEVDELEAILTQIDTSSRAAVEAGLLDETEAALPLLAAMDGHVMNYREKSAAVVDTEVAEFSVLSDEMSASVESIGWTTIVMSVFAALLGIGMALLVTRGTITMPLARLGRTMEDLSSGKLDAEVAGTDRKDEVGGMSRAVQVFKSNAIQARALEEEAVALRKAQEAERERKAAVDRRTQAELQEFVDSIEGGFARLSQGDMTVRIGRAVAAQYEPIRGQFNDTVEKLESTLGSVVTSIGSIRTGLGEINVASNDLAQRTEQQAASLEETVAALAEVTRAVNETAQDAGRAQESAESANRNAAKGGEIVGKAVEAMRGIEQSSEKIGKIIGVIDEIAFQTNLLALNAGVEAARAGEAGRGFAVVAQEVRGLAQRSAEAAKEIKDLISTSSVQVEAGVELVSASGRSLDQIIAEVGDMSRTVAEIARRAREQAVSLKEVQAAADQMDKVTQQNAAMVEEATAAAQSLAAETDELGRLIAEFKLASAQSRASSGSSSSAPAHRSAANRAAPSQRPVVQMRPTAQGNAALKTLEDNWEEF